MKADASQRGAARDQARTGTSHSGVAHHPVAGDEAGLIATGKIEPGEAKEARGSVKVVTIPEVAKLRR